MFNDALGIKPPYELEDVSSATDLATYLSTTSAGLVIASLKTKNDLIQIATFLKISKKIAKDTIIKLVVINLSDDKQFEKAMINLGILDLIEPGINTKALKFKIDFWIRSLNVQVRNNAHAAAQKNVRANEVAKAAEKKNENNLGLVWLEPLEVENDIWIVKNENDCKKILSKWLIRIMGPSPYVGQWVEVKASHWRFDFKENEKELFISGKGAWFYQGEQRPEFIWKENTWLITGDNFDLYFKDDNQIVSRLKSKTKNLTVCKNSVFAKTKESLIVESFDKDLILKREDIQLSDLEGKNKTEKFDSGPLSGKGEAADNINGNLSGKTKGEEPIKSGNLVQKTETEKKSSYWDGKNTNTPSIDSGLEGPNSRDPGSGAALELDRNDLEHQTYYKKHNEAQQYDTPEAKERKTRSSEDRPSDAKGNLSGKSNTDEIEKNYDNSQKDREKREKQVRENELSGKSDTDRLKSHYGQKDKTESSAHEKESQDLSGETTTDKLNSHFGKPKGKKPPASIQEEEGKEKEAKSKEALTRQKVERENIEAVEREKKENEDREIDERTRASVAKMQAKERELKDREEQLNNDRNGKDYKQEKDQKAKRKTDYQEEIDKPKSKLDRNPQDEYDFGMKGEGSTEKFDGHYKTKKEGQGRREKEEAADAYAELFGKDKPRTGATFQEKPDQKPAVKPADDNNNVLQLNKTKEDKKPKTAEEKEIDELTKDAKVFSYLTQNNKKYSCHLDDFFDEMIIFKTSEAGINASTKVSLDIVFKFLEKDTKLLMHGDVLTVEGDGEGSSFVTVKVNKDSVNSFDAFMRLYEKKQSNVDEFLKKVKGL